MTKAALRNIYLKKRENLNPVTFTTLNKAILENIKTLHWQSVSYLHCFWPIINKHEVDTIAVINWLQTAQKHVNIVLPKADFTANTLQHYIYEGQQQLVLNKYGIMEPHAGKLVEPDKINRVLVPLLICDKQGHRVGYGKGFYDKFLSECAEKTEFIGLSLFEPIDTIEDINEYDVKLHTCVTPDSIYTFLT